jgi:hypothetical protein
MSCEEQLHSSNHGSPSRSSPTGNSWHLFRAAKVDPHRTCCRPIQSQGSGLRATKPTVSWCPVASAADSERHGFQGLHHFTIFTDNPKVNTRSAAWIATASGKTMNSFDAQCQDRRGLPVPRYLVRHETHFPCDCFHPPRRCLRIVRNQLFKQKRRGCLI